MLWLARAVLQHGHNMQPLEGPQSDPLAARYFALNADVERVAERVDRLAEFVEQRLVALEEATKSDLQELTLAIDDGIKHVDRSERRVRQVIASSKRRFEAAGYEDEGLLAEEAQLSLGDGKLSQAEGVPPVSNPMDADLPPLEGGSPWAVVPGIQRLRS